ncbi:MAG: helical backbone metal receptor [Ignavibacteria bacterium]
MDKERISVIDDLGNEFDFNEKPVRVISLAPSITESIFFLGLDSNLIGVTQYCDFPEQAKLKTNIGGMLDPNLEIITNLNPDLIFLTTEGNSQITYKSLKDLGLRVFVLNPKNVDGIVSSLEKLNLIFKNPVSDSVLKDFKMELKSLSDDSQTRMYAGFLALKPLITFNKKTFLNDVFKMSGFSNVYENENLDYPSIAEEDLFSRNPDYLFIFADKSKELSIIKELEQRFDRLKSVREKSYFVLDENVFTRPGPRVLNSIKMLKTIP